MGDKLHRILRHLVRQSITSKLVSCRIRLLIFLHMHKISVLLPVKNGEKYIADALESILQQSYEDFELLIFDDNSTDHTLDLINGYRDTRIKLFSGKNGFIANLNQGIADAEGAYIARMDADDLMYPRRLETQFRLMEKEGLDLCGSWMTIFGEGFDAFVMENLKEHLVDPLKWLLYKNFIAHPTTMLRKEFLMRNNLWYDHDYPCAEDYKLWVEMAKKNAAMYIYPQPLLYYRISADQVTSRRKQEMLAQTSRIQEEIYECLIMTHEGSC